MILGSGSGWASRFSSIDERLLTRIAAVWPRLLRLLPGQPDEDTITINLVELLFKDAEARSLCHWIEYQFEPVGIDEHGAKFSKGKIDIAVFIDQDRGQYLAFECKRLNVVYANGRQSLATAYVTEGLMRFVSEQYAETLDLGYMLGYVLDGDMVFCMQRLQGAVAGHSPVNLAAAIEAMTPIAGLPRFRTVHSRKGGDSIEVRHALLSHIPAAEPA